MSVPNPLKAIDECPAAYLEGRDLGEGWTAGVRITRGLGASGGQFSVCYHARHSDGREGFIKAFDFPAF